MPKKKAKKMTAAKKRMLLLKRQRAAAKARKKTALKKKRLAVLQARKLARRRSAQRKRLALLAEKARKARRVSARKRYALKTKKERRARRRAANRRRLIRWTYFDKKMVLFLSNRRIKSFTGFMKFMTRVGDGVVWFVLCVVFLAIDLQVGLALAFSSIIQILLQQIIKRLFSRERPYEKYDDISRAMRPPDRFSFPSGHTAGAFAIAFVLWTFPPFRFLFYPMLVIASLIAFSRMYLGLHFPTDIVAGIILGAVSAILGTNLAHLIHF